MTANIPSRRVKLRIVATAAAVVGFGLVGWANATVYPGNGATGFGGPVGLGNLTVTDDGVGNLTLSLNISPVHPTGLDGNNLVIYVSTGAPGLVDTQSLTDTGSPPGSDNGHTAISGYNNFNQNPPTRTVIAFPAGFQAAYAFSYANVYDGLFQLPTDGSGNLSYITGAAPINNNNTLTIPMSLLGLTQGQSFQFVATDIDGGAAYRSNEAIGSATVNGTSQNLATSGNPGFNNLITFTSALTYTTTAVPEPASLAALALSSLICVRRRRSAGRGR